jgi:hypothetical protein
MKKKSTYLLYAGSWEFKETAVSSLQVYNPVQRGTYTFDSHTEC